MTGAGEASTPSGQGALRGAGAGAWRERWPLAAGVLGYVAMLGAVAFVGFTRTAGHLTYALDDAYIHMALAKNLALHGVLGATRFEFTSASSSPLWTFLLALVYRVTGVHDATALVLDAFIGLALVVVTDVCARRLGLKPFARFLAIFWVVFATPLAPIVFGGMEHPSQVLFDVAFVTAAALLLARDDTTWTRSGTLVVVLAALVGGIRYEGILLVGGVAVLAALRRRYALGGAVLVAGVLPVTVFGLYSLSQGGGFLPNPVLIKTATSAGLGLLLRSPHDYWLAFLSKLPTAAPLYPLVIASAALLLVQSREGRPWRPAMIFPLLAVVDSLIHLSVGDVGWFFRYEDYMVALLGIGLIVQLADLRPGWRSRGRGWQAAVALALVVGVVGVAACANRGNVALRSTPWAVKNIYDQQYQMAHFLKANPQFDRVAIGDLGAVSYYNDGLHILDLEGLGTHGLPLSWFGPGRLTAARISQLDARFRPQIAIVFPDYFDQPAEWRQVASWTIGNDLVTAKPSVIFCAIPPTDPAALERAVRQYSATALPADVAVGYGPR